MTDPVVRSFLLSHYVRYDSDVPRAPYSIENVLFRHRVSYDETFPLLLDDVWLFARIEGTDTQEFWVDVRPYVRARLAESLALYGPYRVNFGPIKTGISRAWRLRGVPLPQPGRYTFRMLWQEHPLAEHRMLMED